jgi:hypothetical protein
MDLGYKRKTLEIDLFSHKFKITLLTQHISITRLSNADRYACYSLLPCSS